MRFFRTPALGALMLALGLVLSACSSGGGSTASAPTTAPAPTAVPKPTAPPAASAAPVVASPATAPSPAPAVVTAPSVAPVPAVSPVAAASPSAAAAAAGGPKPTVKVGSANFPESVILGELYGQMLQANGYTIERHLNLGTRQVTEPALESGQIDLMPEYAATELTFLNSGDSSKASGDPAATTDALRTTAATKGLTVFQYSPAIDTNGFVVTKATAAKYNNLSKVSDLQAVASQLVFGGPPECPQQPFCIPGLQKTYGITFKDFKPLDTGGPLTVAALTGNQVDVAELFTTDPSIKTQNLVLLQDDKHLQLADNIVPIVRTAIVNQSPDMAGLLNQVSTTLTTDDLTGLIDQVQNQHQDAQAVAGTYLKSKNLVK